MSSIKKYLEIIILIIILGFITWYILIRKEPVVEPLIRYKYKTDTIYADTIYIPGKPYPIKTPPKTITIYEVNNAALDSLIIIISQDSIIISDLKFQIAIHENYLKQFPSNPKLIQLGLHRDTLSLGLLNIGGFVSEYNFPIYLNEFRYKWTVKGMSHETYQLPTLEEHKPFAHYFVGGGVDLLYLSPIVSGKIEKSWTRIRLYGTADVGLLKKEASSIKLGIDYRINGKN